MTNDIKVGLGLAVVFALLIALFYYLVNDDNKYSWDENYAYDNDQPYGTDMLFDLLGNYKGNNDVEIIDKISITKFLQRKKIERDSLNIKGKSTYFIIGRDLNFIARDYETLYEYISKGNTVMIVSSWINNDFLEKINPNCYSSSMNNTTLFTLKADFTDESLKKRKGYSFFYEYASERNDYNFSYFGSNFCREQNYETLGTIRPNKANFVKIELGKGQILLHSNPLFFTNRHLIRKDAFEYASKVFSYLPEGEIYWDKHNKPIKIKKPAMEGNEDDTPFSYILKQRGLRWALYMIYVAVALFLIFNLFRKQKQIPVLFQNKNTSLEFIKNVGTLYFDNKNNKQLANKLMLHFMNEVRLKYYINDKKQETIIDKLALKTKVDPKAILAIFKAHEFIEKLSELSDDGLVKFYLKIEKFHNLIKK